MPGVLRSMSVAPGRKRAHGLSHQGDPTLAAVRRADEQTDPNQAGSGRPGAAVEHLLVNVGNEAVLAGHAPADRRWEVACAHGLPTVRDEWPGKRVKSNAGAEAPH